MKTPRIIVVLMASLLLAPTRVLSEDPAASAEKSPEEILLEAAQDPEADFFEAYETAKEAGVPDAYLLQTRIIKMLRTGDLKGLLGLTDKIEALRPEFDVGFDPTGEEAHLWSSDAEVGALINTLKAIKAYQDDDFESFKELALSAYWEGPTWPQIFGLHEFILQLRTKELIESHIANLTLPLDTRIRDLDGNVLAFGDLIGDHKAVLFDFWASWCGPCLRLMPELQKRSDWLSEQGILVAAVNTDDESPLERARTTRDEKGMNMPWLVEAEGKPFSTALFIDSIPRMVLFSPQGKVIFSGHPMDDELDVALEGLGVRLP